MGGQFGGATTASLTPFLAKHFGWEMSFWAAAGFCLLSAAAWLSQSRCAIEDESGDRGRVQNFGSEEASYKENS